MITGQPAADFALPSDDGTLVSLKDFRGKYLIVYFYPRDDTPGCTREAIAFTRAQADFAAAGASIVGISKDSVASHAGFRDKHQLGIKLLSDTDLAAHQAYGAFGEKVLYGKRVLGVIRSTFLISPGGEIVRAWKGVKVDGHETQVLAALTALTQGASSAPTKATGLNKRPAKSAPTKK